MEYLDFRSDTVTLPTPEMREAMANAAVGDDVYGEDPTINQLQAMTADMLGKEAALLVPSGTMGNLAAILSHCQRGDELITGHLAHTFLYEAGGMAALGGVQPHTVQNQPDGTLKLEDIRAAIRPDDPHFPITRMVTIENTQNRCGGAVLSVEYTKAVGALAKEHGLIFHIDGARIFNAAVALGVPVSEMVAPADSVTFCLSKGLAAPVGSMLCGSHEFIARAQRARKQLGGGMRQAGILAAAGIVALEQMVDRLSDDHRRGQVLAAGLDAINGITLDANNTNMVYFILDDEVSMDIEQFVDALKADGVLLGWTGDRRFRMVTHCWIDDAAITRAVEAVGDVVGKG